MRKTKRKVATTEAFTPELTIGVISDESSDAGPTSCLLDETPDAEALKDFGEPDRRAPRQTVSESSGRDGFMRYLASLADESLLTQDDEVELGREMALGRHIVRQTVLDSAVWVIPLHEAIDQLRAGEMSIREIVDFDSFECEDEDEDRNIAVLELLKEFSVESTRYVRLIGEYLSHSHDEVMQESVAALRESIAELGDKIPMQDAFITQVADSVVNFADQLSERNGNGSGLHVQCSCTRRPPDIEELHETERMAYESYGLCLCKLAPSASQIRDGLEQWRRAQSQLVRSNLRLVVCIAKNYMSAGVPFEDMVQEGNLGLIRATEKFEYQRGTRFSTYSAFWIRHSIIKSIERQARTIRLPGHIFEFSNRIATTAAAFQQKIGRPPTETEIADILGVSERKVEEVAGYSHYSVVPLFADNDSENDLNLIDTLPNTDAQEPENYIEECEISSRLDDALEVLSEKERLVVELRNGLKDGHPHSLREVGDQLNLTRERIRQIEKIALQKMRASGRVDVLVTYA